MKRAASKPKTQLKNNAAAPTNKLPNRMPRAIEARPRKQTETMPPAIASDQLLLIIALYKTSTCLAIFPIFICLEKNGTHPKKAYANPKVSEIAPKPQLTSSARLYSLKTPTLRLNGKDPSKCSNILTKQIRMSNSVRS